MTDGPATGLGGAGASGAGISHPPRFAERMTGVEALMWRLGRYDTRLTATMSLVVTLDGSLPVEGLRRRLDRLCRSFPRLRQRVREPALAVLPPSWEPDPGFAVENHVEEWPGCLWEVAAGVVGTPFDDHRPPWRAVVVPGAGPDGDAVVLHLHHSYTDGLGGVRLLADLFDLSPEAGGQGGTGAHAEPRLHFGGCEEGGAGTGESLLRDIGDEIKRAVTLGSRALPWAYRTLAAARSEPARVLRSVAEVTAAIQLHAGAAMGPASPVLSQRSAGVVLAPIRLDLERLRRVAGRIGVTVNDVYLAGLLDGLGRYHSKLGSVSASLRLGLPISSRDSDMEMRNQLFGAVARGPLGSLDFAERARLVHEIVQHGRRQPWAPLVEDLAAAAVRLPGAVPAVAGVLSSLDVLASNVVGPPVPMWLTGRRIASMTPFGPRSGSAINATLISYDGAVAVGLNLDPAAVPDAGMLVDCLEAAFDEAVGCQDL